MDAATPRQSLHPMLWIAAVAVTLLSLVGIGAIMGVIPHADSNSNTGTPATTSAIPAPEPVAPAAKLATAEPLPAPKVVAPDPAPAPQISEPEPVVKPKPAAKHVAKSVAPKPARVIEADAEDSYRSPPLAANQRAADPPTTVSRAPAVCRDCGVIDSVHEVKEKGQGSGLGAVAGGVVGGLLGSQVGKGRGSTLATVAGAVGGAVAGHQIEKNVKAATRYEVAVRMDDGSVRVITEDKVPAWRVGDSVKIVNGAIVTN